MMPRFNETLSFKMVPPPMDYENFGKLLFVCANGDGRNTAAERAWVLGLLDAYGAPAAAVRACAADGELHAGEIAVTSRDQVSVRTSFALGLYRSSTVSE